jgi:hypothetical protein
METRTIVKQVTFAKPFRLAGCEGVHPPGTFTLTLEEEQLDALSFIGWRQIAATLQLKRGGATEYWAINMQDLRQALLRDTDQSTDPPAAPAAMASQNPSVPETLQLQSR